MEKACWKILITKKKKRRKRNEGIFSEGENHFFLRYSPNHVAMELQVNCKAVSA